MWGLCIRNMGVCGCMWEFVYVGVYVYGSVYVCVYVRVWAGGWIQRKWRVGWWKQCEPRDFSYQKQGSPPPTNLAVDVPGDIVENPSDYRNGFKCPYHPEPSFSRLAVLTLTAAPVCFTGQLCPGPQVRLSWESARTNNATRQLLVCFWKAPRGGATEVGNR